MLRRELVGIATSSPSNSWLGTSSHNRIWSRWSSKRNGFNQLLEQLQYLGNAENQEQSAITVTRTAKSQRGSGTVRLSHLAAKDRQLTEATEVQARAIQGMNQLLQSRQSALTDVRSAQQSALGAAQARGGQLRPRSQVSKPSSRRPSERPQRQLPRKPPPRLRPSPQRRAPSPQRRAPIRTVERRVRHPERRLGHSRRRS